MQALIGLKKSQSQRFLENGARIPVTLIDVKGNVVVSHKTMDKNKYQAVQLGIGIKKNATQSEVGHAKGAKLEKAPKFLKEVRIKEENAELPEVGSMLNPEEVFAPGDMVDVIGFSKGKGFQGGVKRHGFQGGPKTHGQSDRHRAPGSIGQGTTPGRVYRGKRMAGNMGNDNVTVRNLEVVDVTSDGVLVVKGMVPGVINGLIYIEKVGEDKKFIPLWKEKVEEVEAVSDQAPAEEVKEPEVSEASIEEAKAEAAQEEPAVETPSEAVSEQPAQENKEEAKDPSIDSGQGEVAEDAK